MNLQDKVTIVTGASRGLGKAIALAFAKEGAHVVVAARTEVEDPRLPGTIQKTAEQICSLGRRAIAVRCNVNDEQSVINMVEQTLKEFKAIDILVNNAGVAVYRPVIELPVKHFDLVLAVNVRGTFLCSKYVLPTMIKQRSGSIINISSNAADNRILRTGQVYSMAKIAIEQFTYRLAAELAEYNIAVNCVKPRGTINTEGMRFIQKDPAVQAKWDTSEMIEKAAIFLAQQDGHGLSGTVATDEQLCIWHALR